MSENILVSLIPPRLPVAAIVFLYAATGNLFAGEVLEGPVLARVERVVDGDTVAVTAAIWIGQDIRVSVRVNGIDTPELKGKCSQEMKLAQFARRFVVNWTYSGWVKLKNIKQGKYAGRVIADVFDSNGRNLAVELLKKGLAIPYSGGKRPNWCGLRAHLTTSQVYRN